MELIFLKIVNMSAAASWIILAVLLLRFILKKVPRAYICVLWAMVGIRLVLPFSFESKLSLLPSAEVFPEEFLYAAEPKINSGIGFIDNALNPVIAEGLAPAPGASANPAQINATVFSRIWVLVVVLMLVYMAVSFIRIKSRVHEAVPSGDNVWFCDHVDTPFILGITRPRIYLPSDIGENDAAYVVAHEKAHIKRLDFIWKPLGFLILAVHCFNPLVWLSYVLFCRDIEFACDERVVKGFSSDEKKEYSEALLNLSMPKHVISACPLAFGEVGVKERIKSVLSYKKPAFWVAVVSVILVIAIAVGFWTSPFLTKNMPIDKSEYSEEFNSFIDELVKEEYNLEERNGSIFDLTNNKSYGFDWEILGAEKNGRKIIIYASVMVKEYRYVNTSEGKMWHFRETDHTLTAIVIEDVSADNKSEEYRLVEYWRSSKEEYETEWNYVNAIISRFPEDLWDEAFSISNYADRQSERCDEMASIKK